MEKILIISAFYLENNTSRPYHIKLYFEKKGFKVKVITTNFNHSTKRKEKIHSSNVIQLNVPTYSKTFSFKRILSHMIFACKIKKYVKSEEYDLIYVAIPPNYSARLAVKISKKMGKFIITDVIDIWPQNSGKFPFSTLLNIWTGMRNKAVIDSNIVLIETSGYKRFIDPIRNDSQLLYLTKTLDNLVNTEESFSTGLKESVIIGYLGNFSDSYDFRSLVEISKLLNKKYLVKIIFIGDGYLKNRILKELEELSINYDDYGILFNEADKKSILKDCHFGYNAVNKNITVGLSYKSIDYLSYGLPLLNNLDFDTRKLVDLYNAGVNFDSVEDAFKKIDSLSMYEYMLLRKGAQKLFEDCFSFSAFNDKMDEILTKRGLL